MPQAKRWREDQIQGQARERRSNTRSACEGGTKISLVGSDACRTKGRGGPLQGSVVWLLSQLLLGTLFDLCVLSLCKGQYY